MIAIAELKAVMPIADPHNYDEETKEYIAPKTEGSNTHSETV